MVSIATLKDYITIFSGLLTPIIACITIYIAYQQHKTSRQKLKYDLYEKRFKIYLSLMKFLSKIIRDSNITIEDLNLFLIETNESIFLLDNDICEYLDLIYNKGCEIRLCNTALDDRNLPIGEDRNKLAEEQYNLSIWFSEQYKLSNKKFDKYLHINL